MKPVEAFQFLYGQNLPLILSIPLIEEKGHLIKGKGTCYVEKIFGSSSVNFCRFTPFKSLYSIRDCQYFCASFEVKGKTYGCIIEDFIVKGPIVTANIPDSITPYLRRFLRVEPSLRSPVNLYLNVSQYGTVSFSVKDISERGIGFIVDSTFNIEDKFVCGIEIPIEGRDFILTKAAIVNKRDPVQVAGSIIKKKVQNIRLSSSEKGTTYGLELFPHYEDEKKIRLYIMQRDVEIRRIIQEQW